jgi:hypothetical protein
MSLGSLVYILSTTVLNCTICFQILMTDLVPVTHKMDGLRIIKIGLAQIKIKRLSAKQVKKSSKKILKERANGCKLVDLVCTKGFFLYKSGQTCKKRAIRLFVYHLILFGNPVKCDQMPPNEAKHKGLLLMYRAVYTSNGTLPKSGQRHIG